MGKGQIRPLHEGDDTPRLVVCNIAETFKTQKTNSNSFVDVCEFHFPALKKGAKIFKMEIRSDPPPSLFSQGNVHPKRFSHPCSRNGVPFSVTPGNRIFVITISALADHDVSMGRMVAFRIFVPLSTLMLHVGRSAPDTVEVISSEQIDSISDTLPKRKLAIPWSEWGTDGSRAFSFMSPELDQNSGSYVYGSRFATRYPTANTSAARVQLLDFNQAALRKNAQPANVEDLDLTRCPCQKNILLPTVASSSTRVVTEPAVFREDSTGVFVTDLETRLPYRETLLNLTIEVCGVMISEDCLVLEVSDSVSYYPFC